MLRLDYKVFIHPFAPASRGYTNCNSWVATSLFKPHCYYYPTRSEQQGGFQDQGSQACIGCLGNRGQRRHGSLHTSPGLSQMGTQRLCKHQPARNMWWLWGAEQSRWSDGEESAAEGAGKGRQEKRLRAPIATQAGCWHREPRESQHSERARVRSSIVYHWK